MSEHTYKNGRSVVDAIPALARNDDLWSAKRPVSERMEHLLMHRFLARVFSEGEASPWLLKGGFGILARVAGGRVTRDIDVQRPDGDVETAVADLGRLASADAGDFIEFSLASRGTLVGIERGEQLSFNCSIGGKRFNQVKVDVVVSDPPIGSVEVVEPLSAPRNGFISRLSYRLYPVVDQIADKLSATAARYGTEERPSTRTKDLIDLALLIRTQELDSDELRLAINTGFYRRRLEPMEQFQVPDGWERAYARLAAGVPAIQDLPGVNDAVAVVAECLDPIMDGTARGTWTAAGGWVPTEEGWPTPPGASEGEIWVAPHNREGSGVRGHWRRRHTPGR